ncbi:MAG: thioredoxin family protein [Beijerinckiaceae bacterium]|jgi:thiol-disulfide isomerase/thioredoxin|nr:thioredoxin family protein [Beijerinckiaceae bacterium]
MSLSRRALMAMSGLALSGGFFVALAALPPGFTDYSKEKFEAALKGAKPVLVHVHADWCPVCVRQERAFKEISESADFKRFNAIQVNFDMDTDFRKAFNVNNQSVILIFKGGKEAGRIGGVTDPAKIGDFLASVK